MKRTDGVKVIAIYYFVTGGLSLIGALFGLAFGLHDTGLLERTCGVVRFLSLPFALASLVGSGLLYGIVALAVGGGLLQYYSWARWLATVLAALTLLDFPIGTIAGALIIWYLLRRKVAVLFE